jgi:hypothetical protein
MTAGSDIVNGAASSLTDRPGCLASRITSVRRVGSDSAAKVRSRAGSKNLTIWFSIGRRLDLSTVIGTRDFARSRWLLAMANRNVRIHPFLNFEAIIKAAWM